MNSIRQTLIFVVLLGVFASALLLGMNVITSARIEQSEEALIQSAILDGFEIEYSFSTIGSTFGQAVTVYEYDGQTFYQSQTGRLSFQFEGSGLWGPIIGILTLESDLKTIAEITILQHEETPGLGGVVAEDSYLDTFVGKQMLIDIVKDATTLTNNQVDAITGATRTSDAFEILLNENYNNSLAIWRANEE